MAGSDGGLCPCSAMPGPAIVPVFQIISLDRNVDVWLYRIMMMKISVRQTSLSNNNPACAAGPELHA